jgi:hypothetical protein
MTTSDRRAGRLARMQLELRRACSEPAWSACRTGHIARVVSELVCARFANASARPECRLTQVSLFDSEE